MIFDVVFSPAASADLEREGDRLAAVNPYAAAGLVAEIERRCAALDRFPARYPRRENLAPGLRMMPVRRWPVFYRILPDAVVRIERIIYGPLDPGPEDFA
ncbi:MAG TPA: type II toxin-antitoxin system RelE/ParE family toxin [Vineibacter sp.]|nr:type II toxin-antitoxin system RelE/ParE family toxin [Vineibacter sp.]